MLSKGIIILLVIIQFIATILLSFLVLGCIDSSSNYSNIYLLSYQFNSTSPLFDYLSITQNSTTITDNFEDLQVRIGYYGICLDTNSTLSCSHYNNLNTFPQYKINFLNTKLDLVTLAQAFSEVCHPIVLLLTILLTILTLILLCYVIIPFLPGKFHVKKALVATTFINSILWGLGAMLQHEAVKASAKMMQVASMELLLTGMGKRAEVMTWVGFLFLIIVCIGVVFDFIKDWKFQKSQVSSLQKL